jgi:hypothetical protein
MCRRIFAIVIVLSLGSPAVAGAYTEGFPKELQESLEHEGAEIAAKTEAEARHKQEEEQAAKAAQERSEQEVRKIQEEKMAREEAAESKAGESQESERVVCVKTRSVLRKHHCQLGKVSEPHGHKHGALVVTKQQYRSTKRLPEGSRVGVTLGPASVPKRKSIA